MCSLFGWLDYQGIVPYRIKKKLTQALANAAEERGTDAAGISYVHGKDVVIFKRPKPAHKLHFSFAVGTMAVIGEVGGRRKREIILKTMLKTDSSVRSFTMNDALYNYLKTLKAEQEVMIRETNAYKDFVCVNAVGTLILPDSITHYFTKLLDRNNLPHIKFHALRHSCISLLANNTAFSMKQIQDYAGHGDFLTTFNVYSHSDVSAKKTEMDYITSCFTDLFGSSDE
ncbi:MAG: tyrosine-type recombinase/integrase [Ruminococcus sp.]|nr:tyrosine-type recombinase/integrase [Ruminococcus sp.]